jgi:hypothetical protein
LAEGWEQNIPKNCKVQPINNFSITLAYLPKKYWNKINKTNNKNKTIHDGIVRYSIIETPHDSIIHLLFDELAKSNPSHELIESYLKVVGKNNQHSWLVIQAKHFLKYNSVYNSHMVSSLEEYKIRTE